MKNICTVHLPNSTLGLGHGRSYRGRRRAWRPSAGRSHVRTDRWCRPPPPGPCSWCWLTGRRVSPPGGGRKHHISSEAPQRWNIIYIIYITVNKYKKGFLQFELLRDQDLHVWLAGGFGVNHSWYCELVYSLSPHPGLRLSGIQRGQHFLRWPVRRWRSISRCWRRTPPEDAPTSPAGWWGCAATPGCSPALNCTLTEGEEELCLQVIYTKTSVEKPADGKLLW